MLFDSAAVDEVLLVLKIAFLVLLYLFIWRIVRTGARDLRLPQESFIHSAERKVTMYLLPIDEIVPKADLVRPPLADHHKPYGNTKCNGAIAVHIVIIVIGAAAGNDRLQIRAA